MTFNQSSYGVMEDDYRATLMITLSQPSSVEFTATVNTMDVSAIGMLSWILGEIISCCNYYHRRKGLYRRQ